MGLFDGEAPEHEADPIDRAAQASDQWLADRLRDQAERAKPRFTPFMVEGEPHCPECLTPLAAHRIEAGICVPCLTLIEQQEKQVWRRG